MEPIDIKYTRELLTGDTVGLKDYNNSFVTDTPK
jgi:hypothetical protein